MAIAYSDPFLKIAKKLKCHAFTHSSVDLIPADINLISAIES